MSYEGEELYLCQNGHLHECSCYNGLQFYDDPDYDNPEAWAPNVHGPKADVCPTCGAPLVWWKGVDQTNNEGVWPAFVLHESAKEETCDKCGHTEMVEPPRYQIPSNCGHLKKDIQPNVPIGPIRFRSYGADEDGNYKEFEFDTEREAYEVYERDRDWPTDDYDYE